MYNKVSSDNGGIFLDWGIVRDYLNYSSIQFNISYNCCDKYKVTEEILLEDNFWTVVVPLETSQTIGNLFIEVDNEIVNILSSNHSVLDLAALISDANTYLSSNNLDGIVDANYSNGNLTITIDNPTDYLPISIFNTTNYKNYFILEEGKGVKIHSTGIIITPELFDVVSLTDGIYKLEGLFKKENGDIEMSSGCVFLDCTTKCKIPLYYIDNPKSNLYQLYESIHLAIGCGDCKCEDSCELFAELYRQLYGKTLKDTENGMSPCRCK